MDFRLWWMSPNYERSSTFVCWKISWSCPSFSVFSNIVQIFQEIGSVDNTKRKRMQESNWWRKFNEHFNRCSTKSTSVQNSLNVKEVLVDEVFWILHSNKFYLFHISLHQELHGNDFQNYVQFCEWTLQRLQHIVI